MRSHMYLDRCVFSSQISVAQRACEILGDLAAACAVLPRDASFYLMQSLEHVFSIELPANYPSIKPSSAPSTAASCFTSITCNATVGGFCLIVLRVLCPLLSTAAAFPPHISLKLLLAGSSPPSLSCFHIHHRLTSPTCSCVHYRGRLLVRHRARIRPGAGCWPGACSSGPRITQRMELQRCENSVAAPLRYFILRILEHSSHQFTSKDHHTMSRFTPSHRPLSVQPPPRLVHVSPHPQRHCITGESAGRFSRRESVGGRAG